jgi:nitroreductase
MTTPPAAPVLFGPNDRVAIDPMSTSAAIGHRLYLAAEALGLGATGIGAFYDAEVHRYFKLTPVQGQVVYHFAIGYPVPDPRLQA